MHRLSHPLHDARQRGGSERDRKSASLLDGKTESDTPLVLTTMTEESSTFILVSFDDDSYLIIDERSSGVLQIEHASDDAYARIVLGAYEEGATHQLWRFEPTGHGSYYLVSKRNGLVVDLCNFQLADGSPLIATEEQRMEPAVPFRLRRHPGYGSLHLAGRRLTTRTTTKRFAQTAVARSPSAFSTSSKPSNPRFPSTR